MDQLLEALSGTLYAYPSLIRRIFMEKQETRKSKKITQYIPDPEALTHYFGNDDYRAGNRLVEPETDELDGFSAQGNDLEENNENIDSKSDMAEFKK